MNIAFAAFLAVHAVAHVVGFVVPWRIGQLEEVHYKTTLVAGRVNVGHAGIRAVGVLWLLMALAVAVAATGALLQMPWWQTFTFWTAGASLVLCIVGWPDSAIGAITNVAILGVLLAGPNLGWW